MTRLDLGWAQRSKEGSSDDDALVRASEGFCSINDRAPFFPSRVPPMFKKSNRGASGRLPRPTNGAGPPLLLEAALRPVTSEFCCRSMDNGWRKTEGVEVFVAVMSDHSSPPAYMPGPINVSNPIEDANNFLMPVAPFEAGEGLPYAPMDWPNPGDNWGWRVGKRIDNLGYYNERFIYLPRRIQMANVPRRHFDSKLALERYLKSEFPDADNEGFFAGFSWKVPSSLLFALNRRLPQVLSSFIIFICL
ncbi:hypothetical protein Q3G72_001554 [Acer saccharum]|nr:hypothetical protein Q3G72_001554 [Acer saccharum]